LPGSNRKEIAKYRAGTEEFLDEYEKICNELNEDIPGYDYSRFLLYFFCPEKGPSEARL
jgi:hypothetical protein